MRCDCKQCHGSGEIPCPDCDGSGDAECDILEVVFDRDLNTYDELMALKADAKRVTNEAARLSELRPNRTYSYERQLRAVLSVIEDEATKLQMKEAQP